MGTRHSTMCFPQSMRKADDSPEMHDAGELQKSAGQTDLPSWGGVAVTNGPRLSLEPQKEPTCL